MAAQSKEQPLKDWHGNVVPGVVLRSTKNTGFKVRTDENGRPYWMNDGRRDYELPFLKVSERNESGTFETAYDSRCSPPPLATA
jgi:hypothetical protein